MFDKDVLAKFDDNYSPIKRIEIIQKDRISSSNTFNSFNTFWNNIENRTHAQNYFSDKETVKKDERSINDKEIPKINSKRSITRSVTPDIRNNKVIEKVLEPLDVLNPDTQNNETYSRSNYVLYFDSRKEKSKIQHHGDNEQSQEIGYRNPFYYCKKHPKIENINYEEIVDHLRLSKLHKASK